jgi:hypothetical protein
MKPQAINGKALRTWEKQAQVVNWLKANGCRHYIPEDARIIVAGNWAIVPTFDIGRTYNPRYGYNRKSGTLAVKIRKYRIRHELRWDNE